MQMKYRNKQINREIPGWGSECIAVEYYGGPQLDETSLIKAVHLYLQPFGGIGWYEHPKSQQDLEAVYKQFGISGAAVARDNGKPVYVRWPKGDFQDYSDTMRHGEKFPSMHGKKQRSSARKGGRSRDSFSFAKAFERGF